MTLLDQKLSPTPKGVSEAMELTEKLLTERKTDRKPMLRTLLALEESMTSLLPHTPEDEQIRLLIRRSFGGLKLELSAAGERYDFSESAPFAGEELTGDGGATEELVRSLILKSFGSELQYTHKGGTNRIRILLPGKPMTTLLLTIAAILLAILAGALCRALGLPSEAKAFLRENILSSVQTMFISALKMVIAPMVFCSITSCIARYSDLSELGHIGGKVLGMYLLTTVLAVCTGLGAFYVMQPGDPALRKEISAGAEPSEGMEELNIRDTIVGIVPENFVKAFLDMNMLQIIFLAALCGFALGRAGDTGDALRRVIDGASDMFIRISSYIVKCFPILLFSNVLSAFLTEGGSGKKAIAGAVNLCFVILMAYLAMLVIYGLLLILLARLNPLILFVKYLPTMLRVLVMGTSSAAIPLNMDCCERQMGISKKVYSLSIPLGATINMDGTCIALAVYALGIAKICGISITGPAVIGMAFSIIMLSIGAPSMPGSTIICLSVLLSQLKLPVEAISLIIAVDPVVSMFRTVLNCTGDIVASAVAAKAEGLMDLERFRGISR